MKKYIIALDQGTTSSRAMVFDHEGTIVASAQKELTQFYPRPGYVEQDPLEIYASQSGVLAEVMAKGDLSPEEIAGIGISNQRETTILWERTPADRSTMPLYGSAGALRKSAKNSRQPGMRTTSGKIPDC